MQLARLEAKGFKSFGDKIAIHFENGITGIVGPNGCGKSNVVDAIRWVLGEQKTSNLRSEKMEDVIFNGTKDRKPHQMAEVSITFNNTKNLLPTEYSQITITRRYYRSGDSEYELNGVQCRLKDINNLFLDTGIGPDSYAIIELKMVEDILKDKDGSRRELFEEAAGVSKFKIRKKQTLKKLEDTDKDLARVEDLLYEIERNLKNLEKQAKQAEKYCELKSEYKNCSIDWAKLAMKEHLHELDTTLAGINAESDKKNTLVAAALQAEAEIEKAKLSILAEENRLKEAQKALNEHMNKIRGYESENKIKNERLKYLADTQDRLQKQLQADKDQKNKSEIFIKSIEGEFSSVQKILLEQEAIVEKLKAEHENQKRKTEELQQHLAEVSAKLKSKQEVAFSLSKSIEIARIQISALKQELETNAADAQAQHSELETFEQKTWQLKQSVAEKENTLEQIKNTESHNQLKIETLETEVETLKDRIADVGRKLDAKQNEFNLTKSLVDNLEGFPEAVRFLKKNVDWVKNVPLLSDILTCDEKYRICIENYLEPFMNYYVVNNSQEAIKAVNLLSDATMGKANFFVLSAFENYYAPTIPPHNDCLVALSVLEYDKKYEHLLAYLLGGVQIITNNQEQLFAADSQGVFITLNGKIIKRKYSVSGGSVGLFEGKRIGRAKNLEVLERQIKDFTQQLASDKKLLEDKQLQLTHLKSKSQKAHLDVLITEYNQLKQELVAYHTKYEQLKAVLEKSTGRKEEMVEKLNALQQEVQLNEPLSQKATEELKDLEILIEDAKAAFDAENTLFQTKAANYNRQNIGLYEIRNKFNSLQQDLEHKNSNLIITLQRIETAQEELKKVEADTKIMLEKADVNDAALNDLYEQKERLEKSVNEQERQYYQARGLADQLEKQLKELQRQKENADALLMAYNGKLHETQLKLTAIKERLASEFEIDAETLQNDNTPPAINDAEALLAKIQQLKAAMERIGQINPMAMEAYNEIKERYDLITQQRADIQAAKDSLLNTISEIDTTARENFNATFTQIKDNFKKVFRSLFTEDDNCDLVLENPDDPLESDIDIIAKPKGKRPQSISALSGGEKTLTAISLLFAIYLIKPAPFCIFDEVDAPLDDANIDKFNNIIKKFSSDSQFIIVTHNKRTMASTDVIYGVTMIETGVSRVVPVDLRSLN